MNTIAARQLCEQIWRAGVAAVDSRGLTRSSLGWTGAGLLACGVDVPLKSAARVLVVGAGKAGAGMAAGVEDILAEPLGERLSGWVNVPADCVEALTRIHLHPARPAGVNEPTIEGVAGSERILEMARSLGPDDLCLALISGGGSALLPAPIEGVSLADKLAVTRLLSRGGATIQELNTVRKQLSRIKGGGLARACRAPIISLVISDVPGDPLDIIASGPTVTDSGTAAEALAILERFSPDRGQVPSSVWKILKARSYETVEGQSGPFPHVRNEIIGSNATAVRAAAESARGLGLDVRILKSQPDGIAREVGRELADEAIRLQDSLGRDSKTVCLLSGGEPVVKVLATGRPQKGGRNQELALAALMRLLESTASGITLLSGGTDGEDGPTDAAGAVVDDGVLSRTSQLALDPQNFLDDNNSYPFFEETGGLLKTGPTHTNVMDLRVVLVQPHQAG